MSAKWLVTGAAGFLGANAGLLLHDRARAFAQCRSGTLLPWYKQKTVFDLRQLGKVWKVVEQLRTDVILHAAAISGHQTCADDPEQAVAVNVDSSRVLSEAAADVGARIIYVSTYAVFSGSRGDCRESDPPEPFSLYGETKLEGENCVRASGAERMIVRTNFFGWSVQGNKSVLEFFVNSLRRNSIVQGFPYVIITSTYVKSLLSSIWELNEASFTGTIHVASSNALSKFSFGQAVARHLGIDPSPVSLSTHGMQSALSARSRDLSMNTELLHGVLGEIPQSQEIGIAIALSEERYIREQFGLQGP